MSIAAKLAAAAVRYAVSKSRPVQVPVGGAVLNIRAGQAVSVSSF